MNILEEIAKKTQERVALAKKKRPLEQLRTAAEQMAAAQKRGTAGIHDRAQQSGAADNHGREQQGGAAGSYGREQQGGAAGGHDRTPAKKAAARGGSFARALAAPGMSVICEVKKASPSKGVIAHDFPWLSIAREYEAAGAAAISCLTEPYWFLGSDRYLEEIARQTALPVLRKDFTIDEYMIYEAKLSGASAVLLICSLLDDGRLKAYGQLTRELGMDALTEAHTEAEVCRALDAGAGIIGVNNRNLKDFTVDIQNSRRLRALAGPEVIFVSESGIRTPEEVTALYENGTDAVLIGETLIRAPDKGAMLRWLTSGCKDRQKTADYKDGGKRQDVEAVNDDTH